MCKLKCLLCVGCAFKHKMLLTTVYCTKALKDKSIFKIFAYFADICSYVSTDLFHRDGLLS